MARTSSRNPELRELFARFLAPEVGGVPSYALLSGSFLRFDAADRAEFARSLASAADEITPAELAILLDSGWRERRAAAWFIAVARRTEFREQLGSLLLASEMSYAGLGYCVALACFGTPADAEPLAAYLDRYLPRPDLHYDQGVVLGALLHLDEVLGTTTAAPYLEPGGPWQQWLDDPNTRRYCNDSPEENRAFVGKMCAFAGECAAIRGK